MSLFTWLEWRLFNRSNTHLPKGVIWTAILSAVFFGIGHLPAMASLVPLTTLIIIRTVFLNAIGGVIFGWLFWRRSLEAAMVSHAATHVGFFIIGLAISGLNLT